MKLRTKLIVAFMSVMILPMIFLNVGICYVKKYNTYLRGII